MNFDISYTFDLGVVVTGTLEGTLSGDTVAGISSVSLFADGLPFRDNGSLTAFSWDGSEWVAGGASLSLDGTQNNFMFSDAPSSNVLGWDNQLFAISGSASDGPIAPPEIAFNYSGACFHGATANPVEGCYAGVTKGYVGGLGDFPPNGSWIVTDPPAVPEPSTWLMMLLGLIAASYARTCRNRSGAGRSDGLPRNHVYISATRK